MFRIKCNNNASVFFAVISNFSPGFSRLLYVRTAARIVRSIVDWTEKKLILKNTYYLIDMDGGVLGSPDSARTHMDRSFTDNV